MAHRVSTFDVLAASRGENPWSERMRPYEDINKPGRVDVNGVEWWACDPYPHCFRWGYENGEQVLHEKSHHIRFADDPEPPIGCGRNCRLTSFSNYCECQGWCL